MALNNRAGSCCSITSLWSLKIMRQGLKKCTHKVSLLCQPETPLLTFSCVSPRGPLFPSFHLIHTQLEVKLFLLFFFFFNLKRTTEVGKESQDSRCWERKAQTLECTHWICEDTVRSAIFSGPSAINLRVATTSRASRIAFSCLLSSAAGEFQRDEFQFNYQNTIFL